MGNDIIVDLSKRAGNKLDKIRAEKQAAADEIALVNDNGRRRAQADLLLDLGQRHELFHDAGGDAFAEADTGTRRAVFAVDSTDYREELGREFYELTGRGCNRNALADATATLAAIAKYDKPQHAVWLRTAEHAGGICIDIGNSTGQCIKITDGGWQVLDSAPVKFRRSGKPAPLPTPAGPADIAPLWDHLNIDAADRPLIIAWLLAALRPTGPYPIATLIGAQGCGKSSTSRTLKMLTDNSDVLLRPAPRDEIALTVSALASRVLALDNLSSTPAPVADTLCRLSTGGGIAARKLYSDTDEILLQVQRPVILNGINDLANRPDLADRCLVFRLPEITARKREAEINAAFSEAAPGIMAALCDGLALALRDHETIEIGTLPRLADFATFAAAAMPAFNYTPAEFIDAYHKNRSGLNEAAIDASPVASAIVAMMSNRQDYMGSAFDLMAKLQADHPSIAGGDGWPRSAKGMNNALERIAPALRTAGIRYTKHRTASARLILLEKIE